MANYNHFVANLKKVFSVTIAIFILRFIYSIIIARLLSPEHLGLIAVLLAIEGILLVVLSLSIGVVIIQEKGNDNRDSYFTLFILLSFIFSLIVFLVTYVLIKENGNYYLTYLPLAVLLNGFFIIPMSYLKKKLSFNIVSKIELIAAASSITMILFLAFTFGLKIGAVIIGMLFSYLIKGVISYTYQPKFIFRLEGIIKFLKITLRKVSYVFIGNLLNIFSAKVDDLLIGRFISYQTLGFYSLAWNLMVIPLQKINGVINMVALPHFKELKTNERYDLFSKNLFTIILIGLPIYLIMAHCSTEIILLLYGEKWFNSGPLLNIFAFIGLTKIINNPGGSLILSERRNQVYFIWNLVWFIALSSLFIYYTYFEKDIQVLIKGFLIISIGSVIIWYCVIYWNKRQYLHKLFPSGVLLLIGLLSYFIISQLPFKFDTHWKSIFTNAAALCFIYGLFIILVQKSKVIPQSYFVMIKNLINVNRRK